MPRKKQPAKKPSLLKIIKHLEGKLKKAENAANMFPGKLVERDSLVAEIRAEGLESIDSINYALSLLRAAQRGKAK